MSLSALSLAAVPLNRRRIFILPTRHGVSLGGLLLVILLGAINYDNALAYLLCFLLGGLLLVAMLHTYYNLAGLALRTIRVEPVFAGKPAEFAVQLTSTPPRARYGMTLSRLAPSNHHWWRRAVVETSTTSPVLEGDSTLVLRVPTTRRGPLVLGRLRIASAFPLGILRAWAYFATDARTLVYPAPQGSLPLPQAPLGNGAHQQGLQAGVEDFFGLHPYRAGDARRAIHWPSLARQDELLVKQFRGGAEDDLWLRWSQVSALPDPEARLAQLTKWVLHAEQAGLRYALDLPGQQVPPGRGAAQRAQVLQALALYQ